MLKYFLVYLNKDLFLKLLLLEAPFKLFKTQQDQY
jgi:hypothetical protein